MFVISSQSSKKVFSQSGSRTDYTHFEESANVCDAEISLRARLGFSTGYIHPREGWNILFPASF